MAHADSDKPANRSRIESFVRKAAESGVEVIAFPEMCVTGYWHVRNMDRHAIEALAETVPHGETTRFLLELSRRHRMTIGAGLLEQAEDGSLYNAYVAAMPNGEWRCHRKIHSFESPHLSCGREFTVFDTPHGCRVGILICYDCNLVENPRINALMGAEILLAPHQTGGCLTKSPRAMGRIDLSLWENRDRDPESLRAEFQGDKGRGWLMRWLPSRAHDNGLFVLFSNGVGRDDDEVRTGNAMILDPYGVILAESRAIEDDMVIADLDASQLPSSSGRRWLSARRPDLYEPLTQPTGLERDMRTVRFGEID
jgi:predicted amidohydrolase